MEALERINRICLGFERALKKGEFPSIEDYVQNAQGEERSQLLRELRHLELDYRSRSTARDVSGKDDPCSHWPSSLNQET